MANDVRFEGKERRIAKIEKCLLKYGLKSLEDARDLCLNNGVNADAIVKSVQPIAFENASWAYTLGCAVAIKKGVKTAAEAAEAIGIGLEAFCIPGSVAEQRHVGLGHGNLGAMLLRDETKCFAFLPQTTHLSSIAFSFSKIQRDFVPRISFIFNSQASSPHHIAFTNPG